jgi:hypothetical protein
MKSPITVPALLVALGATVVVTLAIIAVLAGSVGG